MPWGRPHRCLAKSESRTPVQPVVGVPVQASPYPPHTLVLRNPRPTQDVLRWRIAWMSARASPGEENTPSTLFWSIPWPHSWAMIPAVSPAFAQPPLSRK